MSATTAAVVWEQGGPFTLDEVELAPLWPDEVRVRLLAAGMCHTDLSVVHGVTPFPLPGVLGHEGVGVVLEVGERVGRTRPGDRVLLTFTSCGRCPSCRDGHPAYCDDHLSLNLLGGRRADGTATVRHGDTELNAHFFGQSSFAREVLADERGVVVLPADLPDDELPVLAPLGCGIQTGVGAVLNVLRPRPGSTLVVTGAGAVGLAAVMAARLTAVARIVVVDRVPSRLAVALELGATHVVDTTSQSITAGVLAATRGRGADHVVETTGAVPVLDEVIDALAVGGCCAVVGAPRTGSRSSFDVPKLLPGRTIRGVTLGDGEPETFLPFLVDAYRRGVLPIDRIQRRYRFEEINDAARDAASGVTIKPVLVF
ncbi:NAD(P)-dependent alcohol dehydrogenase [Pseudonocardia sp. TRM90224]|uniref:NAD(P)-dependent alcohol dehydrogenase n=1 Tax=Pseudonocardia sp. TRM90224 TaxID=2812678 RepID=UPI001E521908|nr:NAD(P)-dependent alcohol dehydrogenase [Pseudonocardia sp. TRM90224]